MHNAVKVRVTSHETGAKTMKTPLNRPFPVSDTQDESREIRARASRRSPHPAAAHKTDGSNPDLSRLHRTPSTDTNRPWSLEMRAGEQLRHVIHLRH